jgi:hypothetical protein
VALRGAAAAAHAPALLPYGTQAMLPANVAAYRRQSAWSTLRVCAIAGPAAGVGHPGLQHVGGLRRAGGARLRRRGFRRKQLNACQRRMRGRTVPRRLSALGFPSFTVVRVCRDVQGAPRTRTQRQTAASSSPALEAFVVDPARTLRPCVCEHNRSLSAVLVGDLVYTACSASALEATSDCHA